jgi:hypothetical protein
MPVITTYRTIDTVSTPEGQSAVLSKLTEFLNDLNENVFGPMDIINIQMIAGRVYIHLSDALNRADVTPDYYNLEKASM